MTQTLNSKHPAERSLPSISETARRVLKIEEAALGRLAAELPPDLTGAVQLMLKVEGRVIVSGIGKSGHIGRKISATLTSTGTPSYFVHAAEASHGDLGVIDTRDVVLLISNSGETKELSEIVAYTRRFSISMIAITSRSDSTLAKAADYLLCLPDEPEACPIGMAPTTSTLLTLALGDALAVALMEQRGFRPDQFKIFHPGGKLGAQLATTAELMHVGEALPLVGPDTWMDEVLLTMTSKGFGVAGVIEDGRLTGIVSDGDLRRKMSQLMQSRASEVASRSPVCVTPGTMAVEALAIMNQRKISVLFVLDEDRSPLGILHIHDLLRLGFV
jgi:arabinose-5-phosphate isomerase